jgi:hypothetical protein
MLQYVYYCPKTKPFHKVFALFGMQNKKLPSIIMLCVGPLSASNQGDIKQDLARGKGSSLLTFK